MSVAEFDLNALKFIGTLFSHPALDKFFIFVSALGNGGIVWILCALALLCFKKTRKAGLTLSLSLIFCLLIGNLTLKPLIGRIRPFDFDTSIIPLIPPPTDFSFPSGHTLSSFAGATAITFHYKKAGICAFLLAFLIAFSRLYLMVHYPSDVLFGIVLGVCLGFAAKKSFDFINHRC